MTDVQEDEIDLIWEDDFHEPIQKIRLRIRNFHKDKPREVDEPLKFVVQGSWQGDWSMELFPGGTSRSSVGQVAIFLVRDDMYDDARYKMDFSITVLNELNAAQHCKKVAPENNVFPGPLGIDRHQSARIGWDDFMSWADLVDQAKGYSMQNQISIEVEMNSHKKIKGALSTIIKPHISIYSSFQSDIARLWKANLMCDLKLLSAGKEFPAHRTVLAARSTVFCNMFNTEMAERTNGSVDLSDIRPEIIELLLEYIYTDRIDKFNWFGAKGKGKRIQNPKTSPQLIGDLFKAAKKYELTDLADLCEEEAIGAITVESAIEWLRLAIMLNAAKLKSECLRLITRRGAEVQSTEGWTQLMDDKNMMCHLMPLMFQAVCPPMKRARSE